MINRLIMCFIVGLLTANIEAARTSPAENNKSYHLIYLDISRSTDRKNLTVKLLDLLDDIIKRNDDFLLYLSNGYKPEVLNSGSGQKLHTDNIVSLLQTLNTSPPILKFDIDSILNIWDKNDIIIYGKDGKVNLNYKSVNFHYFISSDMYKLDEDELIDQFLLVKDLTKKNVDAQRIIIELLFSKDDSRPFIERKNQLTNSNFTEYKYLFTSY
jgi:hypothetical protein